MRFNRKGTWTVLLIMAAMALVVAGCGGDDGGSTTAAGADTGAQTATSGDSGNKVTKFAIATPEKGNDFGWNQQGVQAAKKVAQDMGIEVEIADGSGYDNVDPILSQLSSNAQFVIAHASGYNASAVDVAAKTGVPEMSWDNPEGLEPGVVGDAETASQEGAYLAGVLAAKTSKSGTIGIVTSADDTNWNKMAGGFIAGARSVNPDIKILYAQIGQAGYADSAGGKRVAKTVIAGGADVIIGMGDGSSFGMLQAVEQSDGAKFIDVIGDKTSVDKKGVLLSSVLWNFEPAFKQAIEDIDAGTFGNDVYTLNLENGGISLLQTDQIPDDVWTEVEDAKQKIISGEVEVPLTAKKGDVQALLKK